MSDPNRSTDETNHPEEREGETDLSEAERGPIEEGDPRDQSTQLANEERRRGAPFISAVVAATGLWVVLSVFVLEVGEASLWNNLLVGSLVGLAGVYNYYRVSREEPLSVAITTLLALLGLWLIVAAVLFDMLGLLFWSTAVAGILIAGLSGYQAYEERVARRAAERGTEVG